MSKELTFEKLKSVFTEDDYDKIFSRKEIIGMVADKHGKLEVIPSDYCYNRYNAGIDIYKNINERRCLFVYSGRNQYIYKGSGYAYTGEISHKPKGCKKDISAGEMKDGIIIKWNID